MEGLLLHREGAGSLLYQTGGKGRGWVTTFGFRRMRKVMGFCVFSLSCEVGVKVTQRVGEVPGAQVSLVTAAVAALSQVSRRVEKAGPLPGEQETLTGGIRGILVSFKGLFGFYLICYYGLRLTVNY